MGREEWGHSPAGVLPRCLGMTPSVPSSSPIPGMPGTPLDGGAGAQGCSSPPLPRQVIEEVSSDAPSGLAAISVPASPSPRLGRVSCLSSPGKPRHRKGAAGGVESTPQFPVLLPPLGDAGEGCIAVGWGSGCRGLKTHWGRGCLDLCSQAAGSRLGKEEDKEEDCSRQSPARSPPPREDAKGGAVRGDRAQGCPCTPCHC